MCRAALKFPRMLDSTSKLRSFLHTPQLQIWGPRNWLLCVEARVLHEMRPATLQEPDAMKRIVEEARGNIPDCFALSAEYLATGL
eukprot:5447416-Amphidinium_carterae.6